MGVPVITLKGDRFVSRCGYSINENTGLKNFVAENKNEYLSIALQYTSEINIKTDQFEKKLRPQLLKSSLFDANSFAESFIIELNKVYEKIRLIHNLQDLVAQLYQKMHRGSEKRNIIKWENP